MKVYLKPLVLLLAALVYAIGFPLNTQAIGSPKLVFQATKMMSPSAMRSFSVLTPKKIIFSNILKRDARVVLGFRDGEGKGITGHPVHILASQTGEIEVPDKADRLNYIYIDNGKEKMYELDQSLSMINTLFFTDNGLDVSR